MRLSEMIKKAEAEGVCPEAMNVVRKLGTLRRVRAHPQAPEWAVWYAANVIKGRWPEAEPIIAKDAWWACMYARCVIKGPWPEGKPIANGESTIGDHK